MKMQLHCAILFTVLFGAQCAPSGATTQNAIGKAAYNGSLFVPSNAEQLKAANAGNTIAFELNEPYPAERFRVGLENAYLVPRWRKQDELQLFPGRKTSDSPGGWQRYLEGDRMVYMWAQNWVNEEGAVVTYVIRYRFAETEMPSGGRATVDGIFMPRR